MGSATISFGLVSVPVKLYSASDSTASVSFNLIHKDCGSRLKQQYICAKDGAVVDRDDIVKGYEFAKGQYVLFTPEELKALEAEGHDSIDIAQFVPEDQVDPIYFDRAYYLGPDKGGDRAYKLLSAALQDTGLVAVARYAARGREYLVLVRPKGEGLILEQLHYADEIRPFSEVPLGDGEVKKEELKLAVQLVKQSASKSFDPSPYHDEVRERVMALIQRKIEGEDITQAAAPEPQAQIIDLMAALKASLSKGEGTTGGRKAPRRAAKTKAGSEEKGAKTPARRRKAGGA
jgi:DNA end-binding protein Ku